MINKGVELEGLLTEFRAKDKEKEETIEQLRHNLHQQENLVERSRGVRINTSFFPSPFVFHVFVVDRRSRPWRDPTRTNCKE